MANILIGITSGIACYKIIDLVKGLKDHSVNVIMTKNSANLIGPKEFEKASGNQVAIGLFRKGWSYKDYLKHKNIKHISLADKADIVVVAPATANIIGKVAHGIADDLLSTTIMASKAPVLFCPAMNCNMWNNPIVKENVNKLKKLGYYIMEPDVGRLACGYGKGRLPSIIKIKNEITHILKNNKKLKGKKIIITAGATEEEIDPVRVITNKSSGKQGVYIAEEAYKQGADVTLLVGKGSVRSDYPIKTVEFGNVSDLFLKIKKIIKKNDILIHAAAVSDYTLDKKFNKKIKINKKISSKNKSLNIKLKKTKKIINEIKKINKKIKLIGFKAEYKVSEKKLIEAALLKLKESKADLIVANDVGKGVFGKEKNNAIIIGKKIIKVSGDKREVSRRILRII